MAKFFINRPIVAMVIAMLMVIVGTVSLLQLPVAQYPNIVPPEIVVQASYVGADALTIEQAVATPLEEQMSGVDNMSYMYSVNANNGLMQLHVIFDVGTDPNTDQILAEQRVSQATATLPVQVVQFGVTVQKSYSAPLMLVSLYSPKGTYDETFLTNYAFINMSDPLTRVPGVGRVQVFGGQYALRCWVKPDRLAKLGVTVPQIISAIEAQNTVNPAGQLGGEPAPAGTGVHVRRACARVASRRRRISGRSCCAPIRTGRCFASVRSRDSSSARRRTALPHGTMGVRRP